MTRLRILEICFWTWLWLSLVWVICETTTRFNESPPSIKGPWSNLFCWSNRLALIGAFLFCFVVLQRGLEPALFLMSVEYSEEEFLYGDAKFGLRSEADIRRSVTAGMLAGCGAILIFLAVGKKLRDQREQIVYREAYKLLTRYLREGQKGRERIAEECRVHPGWHYYSMTEWGKISYDFQSMVLSEINHMHRNPPDSHG